ncbi:MAG: 2-C-methyl-D-erythritol 4-phosphate cytidylyltransferase [Propionibacteriaceae bacterium]|jgi:2-C-methyl-D-erythritol 4-phosphate cytidylyltransferase|nr:2-C-methyl-D-erythritol 4-phosphate cytidylyltransferase [Propionibacteriaceae bacterium]
MASPVYALIFAGGAGTRMQHEDNLPKQFIKVGEVPIIVHTLRRFQECDAVDHIYVVSIASYIDYVKELATDFGITKVVGVLRGGSTALESIFLGLRRMITDGVDEDAIVLIHDGVRPIITDSLIRENIDVTAAEGNAISSIPAYETVASRVLDTDLVEEIADRKRMLVLQAPQTFRLGHVYDVNVRAERAGLLGAFVDQAHMQSYYGHKLHLVPGLRGNVKITFPEDVRYFTYLVDTGAYARILEENAPVGSYQDSDTPPDSV